MKALLLAPLTAALGTAAALPLGAQDPPRETAPPGRLAVEGDLVRTMGPRGDIRNGRVLIENGRIAAVGPASEVEVPAGCERLRAQVVTPGLIDAKSAVGLSGLYNVDADQDQDEATNPNTAEVRALDGFNPRDPLLAYVRRMGVTTAQVAPGEVNPIAGQAGIFKLAGENPETMAIRPLSAMVFNLGEAPKEFYGEQKKAPSTRMGTAALIRQALLEAQQYAEKWAEWERAEAKDEGKRPKRDLKLEALARVVTGEAPALFVAHRADDIMTALRLAEEYKLHLILSQATEGYLVREKIAKAGVPVLVGPTLERVASMETMNATLENAALLAEAGVAIAFSAGFEGYVPKNRVLLFEAAIAAVNGLGFDRALRAATIDAAKVLGIADRVGSLEPGKDADLVLFDGNPFEYTTHVEGVIVQGEIQPRR
jgi:imidazolonepropionase-like amidohydrolase